jgi:Mg2+ and Co2+ transporter CorA
MSIRKVINQLEKEADKPGLSPQDRQDLRDILDAFVDIERRLQHCENYVNAKNSKGKCKHEID